MTYLKASRPESPLIVLLGPTASGKTRLAAKLAEQFHGEIISADSRQVYRGMDIGTGKDLQDYGRIPYHLIDIVNPGHEYNLFEFARDFCAVFPRIQSRAALPMLVGGTGMYLDAVLSRYQLTAANRDDAAQGHFENMSDEALVQRFFALNPSPHNTTDLKDRRRLIRAIEIAEAERSQQPSIQWPNMQSLVLGISLPRAAVKERITSRLKERLQNGMIEEVEALHRQGLDWSQLDFFGLEYRYIARYLQDHLSYNDMYQKLNAAIHYFAKQQSKWFRRLEKKGHTIHWLTDAMSPEQEAGKLIERFLETGTPE